VPPSVGDGSLQRPAPRLGSTAGGHAPHGRPLRRRGGGPPSSRPSARPRRPVGRLAGGDGEPSRPQASASSPRPHFAEEEADGPEDQHQQCGHADDRNSRRQHEGEHDEDGHDRSVDEEGVSEVRGHSDNFLYSGLTAAASCIARGGDDVAARRSRAVGWAPRRCGLCPTAPAPWPRRPPRPRWQTARASYPGSCAW
jgi:hypothetical protein